MFLILSSVSLLSSVVTRVTHMTDQKNIYSKSNTMRSDYENTN